MHVCGSLPSETDENPCHELPRWLAGVSQVGARALCLRLAAPYGSPEASWAQDQLSQELPVSHRCFTAVPPLEGPMPVLGRCPVGTQSRAASLFPGGSYQLGLGAGLAHAGTLTEYSAASSVLPSKFSRGCWAWWQPPTLWNHWACCPRAGCLQDNGESTPKQFRWFGTSSPSTFLKRTGMAQSSPVPIGEALQLQGMYVNTISLYYILHIYFIILHYIH